MYKSTEARVIQVSEARRELSRLVKRVAGGGESVVLGPRGRAAAVLVGAREYRELRERAAGRAPAGWENLRLRLLGTMEDLEADIEASRRAVGKRLSRGTKRRRSR